MTVPIAQLTVDAAARHIGALAVDSAAAGPDAASLVGVELEWLVIDPDEPARRPDHHLVDDELVTRSLPAGGRVTFEPGGQLELSTRPLAGIGAACAAAEADAAALARRLRRRNIELVGLGADPLRAPERAVSTPRYDAMERFFDGDGPEGRRMMCGTAALQVNVALGAAPDPDARWRRVHAALPVLAAMFANSPIVDGRPSGWRSARLATWAAMDHSRTAAVGGRHVSPAWSRYALDARVMLVREAQGACESLLTPLTLRSWIESGSPFGYPTLDDVDYHLTTLFPPIRPRGWLEVRVIDALPDPWWQAAVAVTAAVADERAGIEIEAACASLPSWVEAARHGLSHPSLAAAAHRLMRVTADLVFELGGDRTTESVLEEFAARYVAPGRAPADDRHEEWAGTGSYLPPQPPPRTPQWH